MRHILLLFSVMFWSLGVSAQTSVYNVKESIKKTGKDVLITKKLQALIDQCSAEGGGYVYFPAGDYLTGSLILKDHVFLDLSPGATLWGSTDINHYTEAAKESLIYAFEANNIGIIGKGTLNGNGDFFWKGKERPYDRPRRFMLFESSQNIRIRDITMLNSPNWNMELLRCDFAWIDGITMISDLNSPNSDGIDPTSSSNVFISNSYFELGDDVICPKSRGTKPTENVVVENCVMVSDDSAIKLGTRSEAPIRNLTFNNIIIRNTQYGIAFFAKDGGTFENIRFSNITIESVREDDGKDDRPSGSYPIFLDIERRKPDGPISYINDVHFSDITINSTDGHCLFLGQPDEKIKNLYFSNINFHLDKHRTFVGSKKPRGVRSLKDRAANDYSHIPSNFTFAYVDGLSIEDLHIIDRDESGQFERHMIWGYAIDNVRIDDFTNTLNTPNRALAQFNFKDAKGVQIRSTQPTSTIAPFIFLEGNTKEVILMNNNFRGINKLIESDDQFDRNELIDFGNLKKQ